jgi:hypothetical protein
MTAVIRDTCVRIGAARRAAPVRYPRVVRGKPVAKPAIMAVATMASGILARGAVIAVAIAPLGGCLYLDPINERPSAEIRRVGDGLIFRGDALTFQAVVDDPDRDPFTLGWRGQACDRAASDPARRCSAVETGTDPQFGFTVPVAIDGAPTVALLITLDVTDSHGAVAKPRQALELPVGNHAPTVAIQRQGRDLMGQFPVGVPITIAARGADADADQVALTWSLFPAATSVPAAVGWTRLPDPASGGEAYQLVPDVAGDWLVRVDAADGQTTARGELALQVRPDHAPCLTSVEPSVADGAVVIATAPRRFAVEVVSDDLDLFPAPPAGDPYLGAARLRWSQRPAGAATFTAIGGAAAVDLDPATLAPGERVELRVEVADRTGRWPALAPGCPIDQPSCAVEAPASCVQRRTWLVEAR